MPCFDWSPPVFVLRLWPWPKPGLIRNVICRPGRRGGQGARSCRASRNSRGCRVHAEIEGLGIEDVGRVDDRRRRARDLVAGGQARGGSRPHSRHRPTRHGGARDPTRPGSSRPSGHSAHGRTPPGRQAAGGSRRHRRRRSACRTAVPVQRPGCRRCRVRVVEKAVRHYPASLILSEPLCSGQQIEDRLGDARLHVQPHGRTVRNGLHGQRDMVLAARLGQQRGGLGKVSWRRPGTGRRPQAPWRRTWRWAWPR